MEFLAAIGSYGRPTFALSPIHWLEAAEDTNLARGEGQSRVHRLFAPDGFSISEVFNAEKSLRNFSVI